MYLKKSLHRKNYGYIVPSIIYHELELDHFLNNRRRHQPFKYNSEAIMRLLLFCRLLYPGAKEKTLELKDRFFDHFDFSLDDVSHCLSHFRKIAGDLQEHLHERIVDQYARDTSLVYYNVTNRDIAIDQEEDPRKKDPAKEKKLNPIVQMGLAVDRNGIPLTYKLLHGNTHDALTYRPVMVDIKKDFHVRRIVVVADKGLNSGDSIAFNTTPGDGYIFSKSIQGADREFKAWVLDESDYIVGDGYQRKSRISAADFQVSVNNNGETTKKVPVHQKQIVFYSEKYALKTKRERQEMLHKAADLIANPSKFRNPLRPAPRGT
ncbi:MAG TPA: hypothetical protein GXZ82_14705 [Firmicutes bacterium]|nr:hypothetical protein [Bacillota bacterium]